MEELMSKLKEQMIQQLNLVDMADFGYDTPLFGPEGLGLDSIDALEIVVLLQKHYQMQIRNPEEGKDIFRSIRSLAEFISTNTST